MKKSVYISLLLLTLVSCGQQNRKEANGFTQGTTYSVIYYSNGADVQYQMDSLLLVFDRVLSTYQDNSYISKWNQNRTSGLEQPQMFKDVVKRSIEVSEKTDDAFDITVSPLMKYWFDTDWQTNAVDSAQVDSIMRSVGMNLIKLVGNDYVKSDSAVQLDVNAIAQGYSVDVLARYLESLGIFNYLVEIGGEVRASGTKPDKVPWTVGIDRPMEDNEERELVMSVELNDAALATSGNYRKFVEINGQRFGHSLDPISGYPATTDVLSATVLAADCMTADAFATACMVLGFDKAKNLIKQNADIEAILIHSDASGEVKTWDSRSSN